MKTNTCRGELGCRVDREHGAGLLLPGVAGGLLGARNPARARPRPRQPKRPWTWKPETSGD